MVVKHNIPFLSKGRAFNLLHAGNRIVVEDVSYGNIFIEIDTLRRDTGVNTGLDFKFDDSYRIRDLRKE